VPDVSGAEVFEAHRDFMFAVAYRMLGAIQDAEDAVQDAWLRWTGCAPHARAGRPTSVPGCPSRC
jgi:RNA polymerase sigma-70 factor (ECF subfamily)